MQSSTYGRHQSTMCPKRQACAMPTTSPITGTTDVFKQWPHSMGNVYLILLGTTAVVRANNVNNQPQQTPQTTTETTHTYTQQASDGHSHMLKTTRASTRWQTLASLMSYRNWQNSDSRLKEKKKKSKQLIHIHAMTIHIYYAITVHFNSQRHMNDKYLNTGGGLGE